MAAIVQKRNNYCRRYFIQFLFCLLFNIPISKILCETSISKSVTYFKFLAEQYGLASKPNKFTKKLEFNVPFASKLSADSLLSSSDLLKQFNNSITSKFPFNSSAPYSDPEPINSAELLNSNISPTTPTFSTFSNQAIPLRRLTHVIPFRVLLALPLYETPQLARAMRESLAKWQSGALYKLSGSKARSDQRASTKKRPLHVGDFQNSNSSVNSAKVSLDQVFLSKRSKSRPFKSNSNLDYVNIASDFSHSPLSLLQPKTLTPTSKLVSVVSSKQPSQNNWARDNSFAQRPIAYRLFVSSLPISGDKLQSLPAICDQVQIYNPVLILSFLPFEQIHDLKMVAKKTLVPLVTFTSDYFRPDSSAQVRMKPSERLNIVSSSRIVKFTFWLKYSLSNFGNYFEVWVNLC